MADPGGDPRGLAAHGLLQQLAGGMFGDFLGQAHLSSSRIKTLVSNMESGDPSEMMASLNELCDVLSVSNEGTVSSSTVQTLVPVLLNIISSECSPEIDLLATRALSNLMEVVPASSAVIAGCGAGHQLCAKLLSIEFIDLAEESLRAIEKLSVDAAPHLFECNAIMAVLAYVDFFSIAVQRSALQTVANMCRIASSAQLDSLRENVPRIANFLTHSDNKMVELSCVAFERLANNFKREPDTLAQVLPPEAVQSLVTLVQLSASQSLDQQVHSSITRTLMVVVTSSPALTRTCLDAGIVDALKATLSADVAAPPASNGDGGDNREGSSGGGGGGGSSGAGGTARAISAGQLLEVLALCSALLPPLPAEREGRAPRRVSRAASRENQSEQEAHQAKVDENALLKDATALANYGASLFTVVLHVYDHNINGRVRSACLLIVHKVVHFLPTDMLSSFLPVARLSSFVASLLCARDATTVTAGLRMAALLVAKLPEQFKPTLRREGVGRHCERLSLSKLPWQWDSDAERGQHAHRRGLFLAPLASASGDAQPPPQGDGKGEDEEEEGKKGGKERGGQGKRGGVAMGLVGGRSERKLVEDLAAGLLADHFEGGGGKDDGSSVLTALQHVAKVLGHTAHQDYMAQAKAAMAQLASLLASPSQITVYEFMSSGVVAALLCFLNHKPPNHTDAQSPGVVLERAAVLVDTEAKVQGEDGADDVKRPLIRLLVAAVQKALAQVEQFPLYLHGSSGSLNSRGGDAMAGMRALTQPLRLQLQRVEQDESIKDFNTSPVLIEALASINAVEDFLYPKVRKSKTPLLGGRDLPRMELDDFALPEGNADNQPHHMARSLSAMLARQQRRSAGEREEKEEEAKEGAPKEEKGKREGEGEGEGEGEESEKEWSLPDDLPGRLLEKEDDEEEEEEDEEVDEDNDGDGRVGHAESPFHSHTPAVVDVGLPAHTPMSNASTPPARPILPSPSPSRGNNNSNNNNNNEQQPPSTPQPTPNPQYRLQFVYEGKRIRHTMSIFQVVHAHFIANGGSEDPRAFNSLWQRTHTLRYCTTGSDVPELSLPFASPYEPPSLAPALAQGSALLADSAKHPAAALVAQPVAWEELGEDATTDLFHLLLVLHSVSENWLKIKHDNPGGNFPPVVPVSEFVCPRLTLKLARQLDDPLSLCSATVPHWCDVLPVLCPFVFGFETRSQRLVARAYGIGRSLHAFQARNQQSAQSEQSVRVARIQRQKVRVQRGKVVESAIKVMTHYASSKAVLEVEFYGEVGTGVGPTMEFYALVADHLKERSRNLWIDHNTDKNRDATFVEAPLGLFPLPLAPESNEPRTPGPADPAKPAAMFFFMGQLVAKSLVDGRLIELPFNDVFVRLAVGHRVLWHDLYHVVPTVADTVKKLLAVCEEKQRILASDACEADKQQQLQGVLFDGKASLADLCLTFTLPSQPDIELVPGGAAVGVDVTNVDEYVGAVVNAYLGGGVAQQVTAFRNGFSSVFHISHLIPFSPREVEALICGEQRQLSLAALRQHTKLDHGYTASSRVVQLFFEVLDELSPAQQRLFVLFVTGSPRLPPGGLGNLNPRLTVVRKTPEPGRRADDYLPSVMTCANYIKLPEYSDKVVLTQRLLTAVTEGQGSFHLS